jgi:hypothetical protein
LAEPSSAILGSLPPEVFVFFAPFRGYSSFFVAAGRCGLNRSGGFSVQSREQALIGRSHLVLLDSLGNIEPISQRKITSISIKDEGGRP